MHIFFFKGDLFSIRLMIHCAIRIKYKGTLNNYFLHSQYYANKLNWKISLHLRQDWREEAYMKAKSAKTSFSLKKTKNKLQLQSIYYEYGERVFKVHLTYCTSSVAICKTQLHHKNSWLLKLAWNSVYDRLWEIRIKALYEIKNPDPWNFRSFEQHSFLNYSFSYLISNVLF